MQKDCRYYIGDTHILRKTGCKCNGTLKEVKIPACKCSLFGKVKEKICDGCKRFKVK